MRILSAALVNHDTNFCFYDNGKIKYHKLERTKQEKRYVLYPIQKWKKEVENLWNIKIDEIDDTAVLRFNYNVLNDPGKFLENEETRIELEQQIGDILVTIIEEFAEKQEVASRTSDTENSDR